MLIFLVLAGPVWIVLEIIVTVLIQPVQITLVLIVLEIIRPEVNAVSAKCSIQMPDDAVM